VAVKNLMIVESPGKLGKLQDILGADWKVVASFGHIRDMPPDEMGVSPPSFVPRYTWIPGRPVPGKPGETYGSSKERVDRLKDLAEEAGAVYLATDPDREGESISWHLKECLKLKDPYRVTFNEVTPGTVRASVQNPRKIDANLVAAQEARRVLDRLVGYMVSPAISRVAGKRLSAGRVQSVALWLLVDRESQIRNFKSTRHYGASIGFGRDGADWMAEWQTIPDYASEDEPYYMNREVAARIAEIEAVIVIGYEEGPRRRGPPPPFKTSTFQQAASVTLGLTPAKAMEAAQALFDKGHITYHRTDNPNISEESFPLICEELKRRGLPAVEKQQKFKTTDDAQAGHPAITPTHWEAEEAGDNDAQKAVYRLIRLRALACQMPDAVYAVRTVKLQAVEPIDGKKPVYATKGRKLQTAGWLQLTSGDAAEENGGDDAEPENPVPALSIGDRLNVTGGKVLDKKTSAPPRYTEASLVKKLEEQGIGRPSTYAAIIANITTRDYAKTEGKFFTPTELGFEVIGALEGRFGFLEVGFTRDMEGDLDLIAKGQASYTKTIGRLYAELDSELAKIMAQIPTLKDTCPACKGQSIRVLTNSYLCDCGRFRVPRVLATVNITETMVHQLCTEGKVPYMDGFISNRSHKPFTAGLILTQGEGERIEVSFEFPPRPEVEYEHFCPQCGKGLVLHQGRKKGRAYKFWGCSGYRDGCEATYKDNDGAPLFE
jgi:DNA topoisomerase-1